MARVSIRLVDPTQDRLGLWECLSLELRESVLDAERESLSFFEFVGVVLVDFVGFSEGRAWPLMQAAVGGEGEVCVLCSDWSGGELPEWERDQVAMITSQLERMGLRVGPRVQLAGV